LFLLKIIFIFVNNFKNKTMKQFKETDAPKDDLPPLTPDPAPHPKA